MEVHIPQSLVHVSWLLCTFLLRDSDGNRTLHWQIGISSYRIPFDAPDARDKPFILLCTAQYRVFSEPQPLQLTKLVIDITVAGVKEFIRLYCSPVSMCCKQWPASWKSVSTSCKTTDTVTMAAAGEQLQFLDLAPSAYSQHVAHATGVTELGTRISCNHITRVESSP
jgi:hypothetical protein